MADEPKSKKPAPKKEGKHETTGPAEPSAAAGTPASEAGPGKGPKKAAAAAAGAPAEPAKPTETVAASAPTAAELLGEDPNAKKIVRAKGAKNVTVGIANILATFNNTQVTITDTQ